MVTERHINFNAYISISCIYFLVPLDAYSSKSKGGKTQKCAVIFDAETIRKYRDEAVIESFENFSDMAITDEYVGNKKNIRFVHFSKRISPDKRFEALNESKVWGIALEKSDHERATGSGERNLRNKTQAEVTMTGKHLENECKRAVGYKGGPGALILLWSLNHCRNMTIFGLDEDSCIPDTKRVFFSQNCSREIDNHDWPGPHNLLMEAFFFVEGRVNQGNLTIHRLTL